MGGDRDIERVVIDRDGLAWINIPAHVARDLLHLGNGGRDMGKIVEATQRMQSIIAGLVRDLRRRVDTTIYYERQEVVQIQAMERNLGVHILLSVWGLEIIFFVFLLCSF